MIRNLLYIIFSAVKKIQVTFCTCFFKMQCKKSGKYCRVSRLSTISRSAEVYVGDYFHSNGLKIMGNGKVKIRNHFHSGQNCKIMLGSHDYDTGDAIPYGKQYCIKNVNIGNYVWLGTDVTICGNIDIGDGAIIAMGAVVVKDVPEFAIVGGNPAKVIKYRDREHFNTLLMKKKFN